VDATFVIVHRICTTTLFICFIRPTIRLEEIMINYNIHITKKTHLCTMDLINAQKMEYIKMINYLDISHPIAFFYA